MRKRLTQAAPSAVRKLRMIMASATPLAVRPAPPRWRRWGQLALSLLLFYLGLLALLWWKQEFLLFRPQSLPTAYDFARGPDVHESWVEVPGARLNALHLRLAQPRGIVFFLHGNGGSLDNWFVNLDFYRSANFDLFMIDYRGYGKSSGQIQSQAQLEADVRAAWAAVAQRYAGKRRVIYGRSLGTGLAASLAAELQPELTVLVSPYTSMAALAREVYPWLPAALLRYPLHTDRALAGLAGPLLLIHGTQDSLVRPDHSQRLQAAFPRAQLLEVPEAGHNDSHRFAAYLEGLGAALAQL